MATLLFVEDDSDFRDLVSEALRAAGHQVIPARCWSEAEEWLRGHEPDIAVVDWTLPDIHPAALTTRLLALPPGCALIVSTGHSATVADGLGRRVAQVMRKPFRIQDLVRAIARLAPSEA